MKTSRSLIALALSFAASLCTAQDKAPDTRVKVEVLLTAEHAPESMKAGSRADLVIVLSSVKTKAGKARYSTKPLAPGAEVASVKRAEGKAGDPGSAVTVELLVTKEQATKVEKVKTQTVTIAEGGRTTERPVPLRLEPAKPAKAD